MPSKRTSTEQKFIPREFRNPGHRRVRGSLKVAPWPEGFPGPARSGPTQLVSDHRIEPIPQTMTVWLHHPICFDDWLLYSSVSPIAHNARGLIFGSLYTADGVQLASVAQEALIRNRRKKNA